MGNLFSDPMGTNSSVRGAATVFFPGMVSFCLSWSGNKKHIMIERRAWGHIIVIVCMFPHLIPCKPLYVHYQFKHLHKLICAVISPWVLKEAYWFIINQRVNLPVLYWWKPYLHMGCNVGLAVAQLKNDRGRCVDTWSYCHNPSLTFCNPTQPILT